MPEKPVVGRNLIAAACAGVNEIPEGLAVKTAGVKFTKPPVQVPPAGVGGHGTLSVPCAAVGTVVNVKLVTVPSASLPDKGIIVATAALNGTVVLIFTAVGGVFTTGNV